MNVVVAYAHHMAAQEREAIALGRPSIMEATDAQWEDAAGRLPHQAGYGEPVEPTRIERAIEMTRQPHALPCPRCRRPASIAVLRQHSREEQEAFCDGVGCSLACASMAPSTSAAQFGDFAVMAHDTLIDPPSRNGAS